MKKLSPTLFYLPFDEGDSMFENFEGAVDLSAYKKKQLLLASSEPLEVKLYSLVPNYLRYLKGQGGVITSYPFLWEEKPLSETLFEEEVKRSTYPGETCIITPYLHAGMVPPVILVPGEEYRKCKYCQQIFSEKILCAVGWTKGSETCPWCWKGGLSTLYINSEN